jgi:hypothetical protein
LSPFLARANNTPCKEHPTHCYFYLLDVGLLTKFEILKKKTLQGLTLIDPKQKN